VQGGLDELRIPGVRVSEALRLPTDLAASTARTDLSRNPISVVLQRTTADFPRRAGSDGLVPFALDPLDMVDAEPGTRRIVSLPTARRFNVGGWGSISPSAPDRLLDDVAGAARGWKVSSSPRFEGIPGNRASSAFDGNRSSAWVAEYNGLGKPPWIRWHGTRPVLIKDLRILPAAAAYPMPDQVDVQASGGHVVVRVARDGRVTLPWPVRTNSLKLNITRTRWPFAPPHDGRAVRAVAIGELEIPGVAPQTLRRVGRFRSRCGEMAVRSGASAVRLRVAGTIQALDTGRALRVTQCGTGRPLALRRGENLLVARPGALARADYLRLTSPAPRPLPAGVGGPDRWLVFAESYSRGWRAWCRTRNGRERALGPSRPIDGFANGWRINGADCTRTRFAFAPQKWADIGYWISAIAAALLLLLLVVSGLVRRFGAPTSELVRNRPRPTPPLRTRRLGWVAAIATGVVLGVVAVGLTDSATGLLAGALALAVARLGASPSRMYSVAAVAIALVLVDYLVKAPSASLIDINFVHERLLGHWLALVAMVALAVGAGLDVAGLRSRPDGPPPTEKAPDTSRHPVGSIRRGGGPGRRRSVVTWLLGGSSSRS
jgi:hypothetical protein